MSYNKDKTEEGSTSTPLKKPLSAWMLFLTENRERIRNEHSGVEGGLKQGDIFKLAGEAFNSLDSKYEATEIISSVSWAKTKLLAKVKMKNESKILEFM